MDVPFRILSTATLRWGQGLLERAGCPNLCDLAGRLDAERSAIIAELFLAYQGW